MMRGLVIRPFEARDAEYVRWLLEEAFGNPGEAKLVEAIRAAGDDVLELVATHEQQIYGQILFSRLVVESKNRSADAVALAPLAVRPDKQRTGVGKALIESAHHLLKNAGEELSVVLGDPAYYGKFGYARRRAEKFESDYQGEYLQAFAFSPEAPIMGRLVYAAAFTEL